MSNAKIAQYFNLILNGLRELGGSSRPNEVVRWITDELKIDKEKEEILSSGMFRYEKDINWARYYLYKAGYIDNSKRGVWSLTKKGLETEKLGDDEIKGIIIQIRQSVSKNAPLPDEENSEPEAKPHREELRKILLSLPPSGFEKLSQEILLESGFENVYVTGKTGDGGIDGNGIFKLNSFLSMRICFQCKRYQKSIGSPIVRDFRGSINGRAEKGIIITTGYFTPSAIDEAVREGAILIDLIDGEELIKILENLGVCLEKVNDTYKINYEFFDKFK